jgi:hypothetical protein
VQHRAARLSTSRDWPCATSRIATAGTSANARAARTARNRARSFRRDGSGTVGRAPASPRPRGRTARLPRPRTRNTSVSAGNQTPLTVRVCSDRASQSRAQAHGSVAPRGGADGDQKSKACGVQGVGMLIASRFLTGHIDCSACVKIGHCRNNFWGRPESPLPLKRAAGHEGGLRKASQEGP